MMPIQNETLNRTQNEQTKKSIENRLNEAGIKVRAGNQTPNKDEYSGIISNSKKILTLKF